MSEKQNTVEQPAEDANQREATFHFPLTLYTCNHLETSGAQIVYDALENARAERYRMLISMVHQRQAGYEEDGGILLAEIEKIGHMMSEITYYLSNMMYENYKAATPRHVTAENDYANDFLAYVGPLGNLKSR